jgi:hypothetical protein
MAIGVQKQDRIEMSQKDRDVVSAIRRVVAKSTTQAKAAAQLGLSVRQVRRLQRKFEAGGDAALIHGLRGKPSNHQPDHKLKHKVLHAYRQRYRDFGPTFASEKLAEVERLVVCPQTLRRWLIEAELWQANAAARHTAAAANAAPALASWCRWTPPSTIGWKAVVRRWS